MRDLNLYNLRIKEMTLIPQKHILNLTASNDGVLPIMRVGKNNKIEVMIFRKHGYIAVTSNREGTRDYKNTLVTPCFSGGS